MLQMKLLTPSGSHCRWGTFSHYRYGVIHSATRVSDSDRGRDGVLHRHNDEGRLPDGQGMKLDLSASKINKVTLTKFSGEWEKDRVKGTINGGGVPVKVDASDSLNLSFN